MDESLRVNIFDPETDLVENSFGFHCSDVGIYGPVYFEPVTETLLLTQLHDDVQVRTGSL